jgi:hypothetical protein
VFAPESASDTGGGEGLFSHSIHKYF